MIPSTLLPTPSALLPILPTSVPGLSPQPLSPLLISSLTCAVIDFGFAKRVPYTSIDSSTGDTKVHAKTYTLCGTPGKIRCTDTVYCGVKFLFLSSHPPSSPPSLPPNPLIQNTCHRSWYLTWAMTSPQICGHSVRPALYCSVLHCTVLHCTVC